MMKVPLSLEEHRVRSGPFESPKKADYGAFSVPGPCGINLNIVVGPATQEIPWEHVSVSCRNRTPNWTEMCYIKSLFWTDEETVMQLHPPRSQWINNHQYCLHLWKPLAESIPLPPSSTVGFKEIDL
jgi:hypothetical protein